MCDFVALTNSVNSKAQVSIYHATPLYVPANIFTKARLCDGAAWHGTAIAVIDGICALGW